MSAEAVTAPAGGRRALEVAVALVLLLQAFILAKLTLPLPGWHLDAPIADFAALGLILALPWTIGRERPSSAAPAWPAWAAFVGIAVISAATSDRLGAGLHWVLRNPVFLYVAYLIALPLALRQVGWGRVRPVLLLAIGATALLSIGTSTTRLLSGNALWWAAVDGVTNNHKTLAVWMAPYVPWLWHQRGGWSGRAVGLLVAAALLLAGSKTALLAALIGLGWALTWRGRALVLRPLIVVPVLAAVALAYAAPDLLESRAMQDAARSRQSLDLRAWTMFQHGPVLGQGPGSATVWEMHEFPHYRINHVEAHGVVQKVASETGLLGLAAWLAFTAALLRSMWRRADPDQETWAWLGVAVALHVNLLASTEAFTLTHWIPLGLAWAALTRGDRCAS